MIKADVLVANKDWKKHIKIPSFYINKKLRKIKKNLAYLKKIILNLQFYFQETMQLKN